MCPLFRSSTVATTRSLHCIVLLQCFVPFIGQVLWKLVIPDLLMCDCMMISPLDFRLIPQTPLQGEKQNWIPHVIYLTRYVCIQICD